MDGQLSKEFPKRIRTLVCTNPPNWRKVLKADPCPFCYNTSVSVDHVVPVAHGGQNKWDNLVGMCRTCNEEKAHFSVVGFLINHWGN